MNLRLKHLFYVTTLLASAIHLFGMLGMLPGLLIAIAWRTIYSSQSSAENFRKLQWTSAGLFLAATFVALFIGFATNSARQVGAARRMHCSNNEKQIVLALRNYEAAYGSLPPAITKSANGAAMHSWRVLILPFLGEQGLFQKYRFDEPWDGPNNAKLLADIPSVYRCPLSTNGRANGNRFATSYCAVIDERSCFPPDRGRRISEVTDGAASTLAIVEYSRGIPWMAPFDPSVDEFVAYASQWTDSNSPPHTHADMFRSYDLGSQVGMLDGGVEMIGTQELGEVLRRLILVDDSDSIVPANHFLDRRSRSAPRWEGYLALAVFLLCSMLPAFWMARKKVETVVSV